ncbi:MAG TPA: AMP-binding protein [Solirubrobacterales bacterium]|jgi:crotonobetaine/carnitine-CoA ligase|nr:AMP-binding protein [Solirubrobacterales bacterium]
MSSKGTFATLKGRPVEFETVPALIAARATEYGDKPLVLSQGETLTYAEADRRSNQIASALVELGIETGDVVATLMYNSIDHVAFWFACAKLGVVWAPLNVSLRGEDLVWTVGNTTAKLLAIDAELLEHVAPVRERLALVETLVVRGDEADGGAGALPFTKLLEGKDVAPRVEILPSTPNAITYTGGSTGMPKGVLASNLYYIAACMRYQEITSATSDDVHLPFGQLFHGSGQQNGLLGPMSCGATTVMPKWFSASRYWGWVREHGVTVIDPIGPIIMALLAQPPSDEDRKHKVRVTIGGASGQIPPERREEFEERFGVELNEQYSQTETGGIVIVSETPEDRRWGSSGRPRGWAEISIRDEDDFPLPTGEVGEITLRPRDAHVFMVGYFNNAEATAETWRNMWHHSGDLGYVDEDGYLFFLGRKAYWMRRKGENVSSYEVERVLDQHESVAEVAVVGVPGELGDEDIKAYVVLAEGADYDPEALIEWCEAGLAYFKVPRYLELVEELPHTAAKGDPDRARLREFGVGDAWERPS